MSPDNVALPISLLLFTIVFMSTQKSAHGDEAFIYGRVELENLTASPNDNTIVGAFIQYEKPPQKKVSKQDTKWELYSFRVPTEKNTVRLHFYKDGYQSYITKKHIGIEQPYNYVVETIKLPEAVPKKRYASADALLTDLKEQLALFDISKSYDVFQYNLALLRYAYRNDSELRGTLQRFLKESGTQPFMASQYSGRQEMYLAMVQRNNGERVGISQTGLLTLVKDEAAFPGIRARAINSLAADGMLEAGVRTAFLDFLHLQSGNSSSLLYRCARAVLAKIGNTKDKKQIIDDLSNKDDQERYLSALIAVRNARLDVAAVNPDTAAIARTALDEWDVAQFAPIPSHRRYIWNNNVLTSGFDIATVNKGKLNDWWSRDKDGNDEVLRIEYPANQEFGLLQIMVHQTGEPEQTMDFSEYTELVVEMRSEEPDKNVDIGIKGAQFKGVRDPEAQTKFKRTFTDVSTEWQEYRLPLRGAMAQLSSRAAANQIVRLQTLKIVTELAFGSHERQVFYIRKIYFARP